MFEKYDPLDNKIFFKRLLFWIVIGGLAGHVLAKITLWAV